MKETDSLRFPIGKFEKPDAIDQATRHSWIQQLDELPSQLHEAVQYLGEDLLRKPYRPGGWNAIQVVHHVADSHMNSYIRFKLALTEENPTIKPYDEGAWALLGDVEQTDITVSLMLIEGLHKRWVALLKSMAEADWERTFYHPENKYSSTLNEALGMYAWHGAHHLAHIQLVQ